MCETSTHALAGCPVVKKEIGLSNERRPDRFVKFNDTTYNRGRSINNQGFGRRNQVYNQGGRQDGVNRFQGNSNWNDNRETAGMIIGIGEAMKGAPITVTTKCLIEIKTMAGEVTPKIIRPNSQDHHHHS